MWMKHEVLCPAFPRVQNIPKCGLLTVSGKLAGTHRTFMAMHQSYTGSTVSKLPCMDVPDF